MSDATPVELMTIAGSRLLRDGRVVFAGVGAPLEASVLAKRLHAPSLTIVLEGGSIGPRMLPGRLPVSTNEMRAARDAFMLTSINDLFLYGQRGHYDYGDIDWDEFWRVVNGDGPCNRERLATRVKAHEDGAWVREAALAHAEKQRQRAQQHAA